MSLYDELKHNNTWSHYNFALNNITRQKRALLSALLELSPICNFTCPFCYARKTYEELVKDNERVLRADYWKRIIDQIKEMGALHLGLTGGECMIHPDFKEIYLYAISKGFMVSMISNMSCMTDDIFEMFIDHPPKNINVTVYGASEETYARICGYGPSYQTVIKNLNRLKNKGINFQMQMTVCKDNQDDLIKVCNISKQFEVPFAFNEAIIPFQRCTESIQQIYGVDKEKFIKIVNKLHEENGEIPSTKEKPFPMQSDITIGVGCSAGRNSLFINHNGFVQPCVSFSDIKVSSFKFELNECWNKIVYECDNIPRIVECNGCIHWNKCKHCFAMHYYDTHDFTKPSPNLCFKKLNPKKAAKIEDYYEKHGVLPPCEE